MTWDHSHCDASRREVALLLALVRAMTSALASRAAEIVALERRIEVLKMAGTEF